MKVIEIKEIIIDDGKKCVCNLIDIEEHTCPYAEELYGDCSSCNCCDYCTSSCAMDI